jgi:hypothetical protein
VSPLLLDAPAGDGIQSGGAQRLPAAKTETGVMQWAAQGVADHQTLRERAVVMRTIGADGKQFIAAPDQDDVLLADTAEQHAAVGYGVPTGTPVLKSVLACYP